MKIIDFEEAKARKRSKENDGVLELQQQYRELVQFYESWYDEHVVGEDENGGWIYKY